MSRRILSTNEIANALEALAEEEYVQGIDVYIDPPCDGQISDGDSGEEDCCDIDRLNRHQLLAPAELVVHGSQDDQQLHIEMEVTESSSRKEGPSTSREHGLARNSRRGARPVVQRRPRRWIKRDLNLPQDNWIQPPPRTVLTLNKESEPLEFFELFFDEQVIRHIVRHSVMYAVQQDPNSKFTLSGDDIYCFLGIVILSGYVPLPRRRMFWETNEDTHNVLVSKSMRRNRFEEIFRYLHASDNTNLREGDKMAKVRPLFDFLNEKFMMYAPIEKNCSIDESMIPYYGRHGCKQHIHGKPIRFRFKVWTAAARLGYCLQADLYEGKSEQRFTGLGEHVVTKLIDAMKTTYPEAQFSVFCDNFFTSPTLLSNLQDKNVKVTGTVRQNRVDKCPLMDVKSVKKQQRGFYDYRLDTNDKICAVRWNDNSVVTLLSNEFGVQPLQKAKRYSVAAKKKIDIEQPHVVHQYNRFMGGVDRLDANVGTYRIAIRGKKWYTSIVMWLIDVAVNNSTLLARSMGREVDTLDFRRMIAKSLLQKYGAQKLHPGPTVLPVLLGKVPMSVRKHGADHLIITGQARKRCAVCKNKTTKVCRKCGVNLHDKCFADFHT